MLLRPLWSWKDNLCSRLDHWIRTLAANALPTLPCRRLWQWRWVVENHFEFILKATGVVTSTNHPGIYPNNMDKTEIIEVESGKILRLEFTHFAVSWASPCGDYVKIIDGDGTTLMDNSCGDSSSDPSSSGYFLRPIITTRSNRVEIFFHTDGSDTRTGWSLSWSAVTSGEKALMLNSIKISHHSPSLKMMISSLQYDWITHQTSSWWLWGFEFVINYDNDDIPSTSIA